MKDFFSLIKDRVKSKLLVYLSRESFAMTIKWYFPKLVLRINYNLMKLQFILLCFNVI